MTLPLSSWLSQISQLKMRLESAGSTIRLSGVLPYHALVLSRESERQKEEASHGSLWAAGRDAFEEVWQLLHPFSQ